MTDDEAFLIAIFRDWSIAKAARETFEASVREKTNCDKLHGRLEAVFAVFRQVTPDIFPAVRSDDHLSALEERVLDALSLALGAGVVRPVRDIERSGRDHLLQRINRTGWRMAGIELQI
ncbi:MAG: hypothetical protein AAFY06_11995 [Pseudomonadota bacterium]